MHVTNSARIKGVGLLNGGGYGSLKDSGDLTGDSFTKRPRNIDDFDEYFTLSEGIANADGFIQQADANAAVGKIDALSNLSSKPVFIASNKRDGIVPSYKQYEQKILYDNYGANVHFSK